MEPFEIHASEYPLWDFMAYFPQNKATTDFFTSLTTPGRNSWSCGMGDSKGTVVFFQEEHREVVEAFISEQKG